MRRGASSGAPDVVARTGRRQQHNFADEDRMRDGVLLIAGGSYCRREAEYLGGNFEAVTMDL
jgi:hypothetical protein